MKKSKTAATGLLGVGLGYGLWRGWESGIDRVWRHFFGSPDLGPVDFPSLIRRTTPNDFLACPRDLCLGSRPHFEPPVFPVSAGRLRAIVSEIAATEANTALVHSGTTQDRYLVRTRLMRFPDTVNIEVLERGKDRSTLALYSRSQIGRSDFGQNRKRIGHWIKRITTRVETEDRT